MPSERNQTRRNPQDDSATTHAFAPESERSPYPRAQGYGPPEGILTSSKAARRAGQGSAGKRPKAVARQLFLFTLKDLQGPANDT